MSDVRIPVTVDTAVEVIYKDDFEGPYTVTPTEEAQTLATAEHTMTDDVTVEPIPPQYIVPTGTKEITNNGTHDVTAYAAADVNIVPVPAPYDFMGVGTEFVGNLIEEHYKFSETAWDTWTPSTTIGTAIPQGEYVSQSCDLENYTYWFIPVFKVDYIYDAGYTKKTAMARFAIGDVMQYIGYFQQAGMAEKRIESAKRAQFIGINDPQKYYNSSGTISYGGNKVGIYLTSAGTYETDSTVVDGHATAKVRRPPVSMKCDSSIMSTTSARKVDKDLSTIDYTVSVYRTPITAATKFSRDMIDWVVDGE